MEYPNRTLNSLLCLDQESCNGSLTDELFTIDNNTVLIKMLLYSVQNIIERGRITIRRQL